MSRPCFLLDENVPLVIQTQLTQMETRLSVYAIGDEVAPAKGTPDPDILSWIEAHGCMLVTNNRATMPVHLQEHLVQGQHVPGIIQLPRWMYISTTLEDLLLIWGASQPENFGIRLSICPCDLKQHTPRLADLHGHQRLHRHDLPARFALV
jgi:hypothetical protein